MGGLPAQVGKALQRPAPLPPMKDQYRPTTPPSMARRLTNDTPNDTALRHLEDNASQLEHRNIRVHVDSVSPSHHAAFCTVQQRHRGWLWRTLSVNELTWRAEQALAPLMRLGGLPMITVRHRSLFNATASSPQRFALMKSVFGQFIRWSGFLRGRRAHDTRVAAEDPFGWRSASGVSERESVAVGTSPVVDPHTKP